MDQLAINTYNLNFTIQCSQLKIIFLHLQIHIDTGGNLHSFLYLKPSAGNMILHASSAHPQSLLNSIPFEEIVLQTQTSILQLKTCIIDYIKEDTADPS